MTYTVAGIIKMTREQRAWEIRKLRTELAFAYSDTRQGGPDHKEEIAWIKERIKELQELEVDD